MRLPQLDSVHPHNDRLHIDGFRHVQSLRQARGKDGEAVALVLRRIWTMLYYLVEPSWGTYGGYDV
jgi:hypothetical protein